MTNAAPRPHDEAGQKASGLVNDEWNQRRRAYEVAKTIERANYERYYAVEASGSRRPEVVTAEALLEFERLKAATEAARVAWEAVRHRAERPT